MQKRLALMAHVTGEPLRIIQNDDPFYFSSPQEMIDYGRKLRSKCNIEYLSDYVKILFLFFWCEFNVMVVSANE